MERSHPRQQVSPFLQGVGGFALLAAMLLGVVGTIYRLVQPDGWLSAMATHGVPGGLFTLAVLVCVAALAFVAPQRRAPWRKNIIVYAFACVGAYYLVQLFTRGVL